MRRLMAAIWTILAMFLVILLLADYTNNKMIEKFNQGKYEQNPFGFLGFVEPYVNQYNRGNIYYSLGQYELAANEYEQALAGHNHLTEPQDCRLRVNYALSLVEQIDPNNITEENLDEVLAILDQARDILCENGCASRDDNSGHYPDAQTLKNEIDAFEEWLLTPPDQQEPDPSDTPTPTPEPSETPTPTPDSGEETPTPTPEDGQTPTPTPEGGDTPTPTPGGDEPTPSPGDDPGGDTPTPTPGGQGGDEPTPTPTLTPEEQILEIQAQGQQERYAGANGTPDDPYSGFSYTGTPW